MQGWIKLHRKIKEHPFFLEKRQFSRFEAWIDLLMRANHQNQKVLLGNELIEVERGSFITSELKLMNAWGWSKTKVRNFLNLLEKEGMIERKTDNKKTTITICNYCIYQDLETAERPRENYEETAKELRKNTNKNEKNEKNEKNNNIYSSRKRVYDENSIHYRLANLLYQKILENNPNHKKPNLQNWANDIRLMMERDNRTEEQIVYVINWCQNDSFWKANILSTKKLREKFDQLVMNIKSQREKVVPLRKNGGSSYERYAPSYRESSADELDQLSL